jgi:two-component sensor histidine kinase
VKAICQTRDSTVWLGSEGGGLTYYKNDTFQWITTFDGLCGNYIKDIVCTPNGRVWVATLDGGFSVVIPVKSGFKIKKYRYLTELPSNRITALDAYGKNEVWFGTESKGIGVIKRGAVRMVLDEAALDYQSVRALRRRGNFVWLATSDGLMRYNVSNKELEKISADIKSSNLYLLEFDKQNRLYLGHERGLEKLTVNETGDVIEVEFYGSSEGFQGIETCQNASFCDRQGNMWFGTVNGLTSYNPNMVQSNVTKPKVWLEKVDLFYESLNSNTFEYVPYTWDSVVTPPRFPYHQNHLSFEFVGIDLNNPSRLSYQWKLEGFDKEWIKPTTKTDAIYSNLPPGDYVLKYRSISSDGQTSDIHRWSFLIHEPVWQTWWFRTLLWVVPILLVLIIVLSYVRRIKIKARRQTEKITLEKELIELEQKALRLQMNPHFLFNALNSIQSLVALENHKDARKYLQKFAKLMRLTLQNSRVDSIPLSDEIGTLQNYMELEQLTKKPAFRFSIDVEDQIQPDDLYIPPMMLQPFIENSIKHGLVDLGDKGQLTVRCRLDHDKLVCEIEDNGIGRVAAQEKAKEKSKTHESAAIQVISDRLDILNQEHAGHSLEIIDRDSGPLGRVKLVGG